MHRLFGRNIRARRRALGLTLQSLEHACGVSAPFIGQVERGLKQPSLETLALLAGGLGTSLAELASERGPDGQTGHERRFAVLLEAHPVRERAFLESVLRQLAGRLRGLRAGRKRARRGA